VLDVFVPEVVLQGPRVLPVVGELEPTRMPEHVRMHQGGGLGSRPNENGSTLENAKVMAAHASVRTTQLYVTLDEVVKINIRG
jgi:hypothetical protein